MKSRFLKFKKISLKLTLVYALAFSLVLIVLNWSVLYGIKYFLVNQSFRQVDGSSNIIITKINQLEKNNVDLHNEDLLQDINPKENIYVKILDNNGNTINTSSKWDIDVKINYPLGKTLKIEQGEKHLVYKNSPIDVKNKEIFQLIVVKDMEHEYRFLKLLFIMMAVSNAIGIIVALISGAFVSKRMLKPIDKITKAAQSIGVRDLNNRIEVTSSDDELSRLAMTFNEMIERLQKSFESQSKFVSDASHELRTPISVIQGYISLLDRWGKNDKEILQEAIDTIKNETSNMTNLIEKLLFLARGDSGSLKLEKEGFCLNKLIDEVIKESKIIAPDYYIINEKNESVTICADLRLIKQALRALIDNSIKYTPVKGKIKINSYVELENIAITIEDTGLGIPEDEIPKLFNRFYRVDEARSKKTGGTGLGLAIVKQIIDIHNGNISINSEPEKGTKVIIKLPLK
jgi:Signal transduction histidine kinase